MALHFGGIRTRFSYSRLVAVSGAFFAIGVVTTTLLLANKPKPVIHAMTAPGALMFRAFKHEQTLEAWTGKAPGAAMELHRSWQFTATSGSLGPKLREGDGQIPEGFYEIAAFNPKSRFHLSMKVNYPNASDRIRADKAHPGFDIFIHGSNASVGCIAIGDRGIEEAYSLAWAFHRAEAGEIPVQIFPARMVGEGWTKLREETTAANPTLRAFWDSLEPGFTRFEAARIPGSPGVGADGLYVWK